MIALLTASLNAVAPFLTVVVLIAQWYTQRRIKRNAAEMTRQHAVQMAASADNKTEILKNTDLTQTLGQEINGRMEQLVAVNRSDAKQEGATEEREAQRLNAPSSVQDGGLGLDRT